jgi:hypothetical protein
MPSNGCDRVILGPTKKRPRNLFRKTQGIFPLPPIGAIPSYLLDREQEEPGVFVPNLIRKCVAFVGIERDDGGFEPKATGFFAHAGEDNIQRTHFVTAEHAVTLIKQRIAKDETEKGIKGRLAVRMNIKEGGSEVVPLHDVHWWSHPDLDNLTDVAVTPWSYQKHYFDHFPLPLYGQVVGMSQTGHLKRRGAGLGQEIAIVGLFRHHRGTQRNEPIIRIGNIAAMPEERVWTKWCGFTEAYLVEANSIGGLSGSPVFVNLSDAPPMTMNIGGVNHYESRDGSVDFKKYMLFGLMHGHWDLPNITDAATEDNEGRDSINTGVGVVIPVQKILETLYHPELVDMRKKLEEKERHDSGAKPDIDDESSPPANDANPNHRADFMRLADVAGRKPPQAD